MEIVFKNFSLNYLDCRTIQVINYLKASGMPVDYYGYKAMESSDKVFHEMIRLRKRKWRFPSNILRESDMQDLGLRPIRVLFQQFADVKDKLLELLNNNKGVFVWVNAEDVLHNLNLEAASIHSIMITDYYNESHQYRIQDIPLYPELLYDEADLATMCNNLLPIHKDFLFFETVAGPDVDKLRSKLEAYIHNYTDGLIFFDYFIALLQSDGQVGSELHELYPHLDDALSILAGSRFLFAKALLKYGFHERYHDLYMVISRNVEILKLTFMKAAVTRTYDYQKSLDLILKIKRMEREALHLLKAGVIDTSRFRPGRPGKPVLLDSNNTNMKIAWDEPEDHLWVTSYEIFKDGELVGDSKQLHGTINQVTPERTYAIAVRARDVFGNVSEPSLVSLITINPNPTENLALYKPVVASSEDGITFCKDNIVDGVAETRWSSVFEEEVSWIYVDLGQATRFSTVVLNWEAAYARKYTIQSSNDAKQWTDIYRRNNGQGGIEQITDIQGYGRYIRIYCEEKATRFGYSLWSVSIFK